MGKPRDVGDPRRRRMELLHRGFEATLLVKGAHAGLELLGAGLLLFVNPASLGRWVVLLTQSELAEDPNDPMARWILGLSAHYSVSAQQFAIAYLLVHGIIKLVLVLLLWRKQLWSYPLAILALIGFIAYQMARWTTTHSWLLILLSLFDAAMIWLTWAEFRRISAGSPRSR